MNNNSKENRRANLYVTLLVILMMVAVVVAIAGAVARNVEKTPSVPKTSDSIAITSADDAFASGKDTNADKDTESNTDELAEKDGETKENAVTEPDVDVDAKPEEVLPTFQNPTGGTILRNYSVDLPVFSITMNDYRIHSGIDVSVAPGEAIFAAADGIIDEVWSDPMMGTCISIRHAGGGISTYANLYEEIPAGIEPGVSVSAGDVIAAAGESALAEIAEEPHLHFALTVNGTPVNPADYIDFSDGQEPLEG